MPQYKTPESALAETGMSHVMACIGLFDRKCSEVLPDYDHHTCKIVASISTEDETERGVRITGE